MQILSYLVVIAFAVFVIWANVQDCKRRASLTERERADEDRDEWVRNIW